MTNKQIEEKIKAAGHQVPGGMNRAKLEALAAEKGVSLEETPTDVESKETLAVIGDLGVKVRPALDGNGFQAVCEQLEDSNLVGFGSTREEAVAELAVAIEAKRESDALDREEEGQRPAPRVEDEDHGSRLITPQMACSVFPGPGEAKDENP